MLNFEVGLLRATCLAGCQFPQFLCPLPKAGGYLTKTLPSAVLTPLAKGDPLAVSRSCVGHFCRSYWTKELSIGNRQNCNSEQFGSGVGYWQKGNCICPEPADNLTFLPCSPCFGNDEVGSSILPSSATQSLKS